MNNDIFVSYRRKNVDFAKQLVTTLEARGKVIWVDWDDIPPGVSSFSDEIERGIDGANIFLAILSPDYLESEHCLAELDHASKLNKRIIPVVYQKFDDYPVPNSIKLINWIYFVPHAGQANDFNMGIHNVIQAMESDYDYLKEHTLQLQRAIQWTRAEKNSSFLLQGKALAEAEAWLSTASEKTPAPAPLHTEFILASRKGASRRQQQLLLGTSVLLAVAVIALIIAVQQFFVANRRADETLSLLIANDAVNASSLEDPLTANSRVYYANTFLDNPPDAVQSILQNLAFQPAPRYLIENEGLFPNAVGSRIPIDDAAYLQQDSMDDLSIRNVSNDSVENQFHRFAFESRDDSQINPSVMEQIQDIQANTMPNVGYDISPDGTTVAMGREGQGLIVWDNDSGNILDTYTDHTLLIDNVQFSEDGRYLISKASSQQMINSVRSEVEYFIWDTSNWQVIDSLTSFNDLYFLEAISNDGHLLMFFSLIDDDLTVWDTNNPTLLWQDTVTSFVQDITFSSDSENVIASTVLTRRMAPPDTIRIYDAQTGSIDGNIDGIENNHMVSLPILRGTSPDTLRIIHDDGRLNLVNFNLDTSANFGSFDNLNYILGYSENGRFVATEDSSIESFTIYDLETFADMPPIPIIGFAGNLSISNDAQYVAYTSEDPETGQTIILVYDTSAQTEVARYENAFVDYYHRAHLFSENNEFVYIDSQNAIHIVDMTTWEETQQLIGFLEQVNDIDYMPDVERLAVSGISGSIMVWDTATGNISYQQSNLGNLTLIAIAPDGNSIATGNEEGQIQVWQMFSASDALAWIENNRVVLPLSCTDRVRYGLDACE
ncbi:MAG: hypothetical protein Phog2KO_30060 [Phototrophicaceae bacterium]